MTSREEPDSWATVKNVFITRYLQKVDSAALVRELLCRGIAMH